MAEAVENDLRLDIQVGRCAGFKRNAAVHPFVNGVANMIRDSLSIYPARNEGLWHRRPACQQPPSFGSVWRATDELNAFKPGRLRTIWQQNLVYIREHGPPAPGEHRL